ncbi:MAG TPA: hypothetical protein GX497_14825 [Bacillus bacterium]|nr:hypothetical protein [Bacillus sp. (in: firmicutes)]
MENKNFTMSMECPPVASFLPLLLKISREVMQHLQADMQTRLCFAVNEGLIHAIKYSNDNEMNMTLKFNMNNDYIEFTIKYYGIEIPTIVFDGITSHLFDGKLWDEYGKWLLVISEIADEWSFKRDEQGRNILKMKHMYAD